VFPRECQNSQRILIEFSTYLEEYSKSFDLLILVVDIRKFSCFQISIEMVFTNFHHFIFISSKVLFLYLLFLLNFRKIEIPRYLNYVHVT